MATRRTGKSTDSGAQQAAQQGSQNLQEDVKRVAELGGIQLADNMQAHMLVTALQCMQSGQYGEKTATILDMMKAGAAAPLDTWSESLTAWTVPALPSSDLDSNG